MLRTGGMLVGVLDLEFDFDLGLLDELLTSD